MGSTGDRLDESGGAGGHDRRRCGRQTFITKGLLIRDDRAAGPQRVIIQDISPLGIGFDSPIALERGTRCRIRIEAGPVQFALRIHVTGCRRAEADVYRVGADFVKNEIELPEPNATVMGIAR